MAKHVVKSYRVAVVGAGWAGLSAALSLSEWAEVTVFEAGRLPGGRARTLGRDAQTTGQDYGQHILLGAYEHCQQVMQKVGVNIEQVCHRLPLTWWRLGGLTLECSRLGAPWHFLLGLIRTSSLSWPEKWQLFRALQALKQITPDNPLTVEQWLNAQRQPVILWRDFWKPLVYSATNTPLEQASVAILANVLKISFGTKARHSDLLLPRVSLSELFPDPALEWLQQRGVKVIQQRVRCVDSHPGEVLIDQALFDSVVLAVPPDKLMALLPPILRTKLDLLKDYRYWSIYTVYLQFDQPLHLPRPMCGLAGGKIDWWFDGEYLYNQPGKVIAVMSAQVPKWPLARQDLIDTALAELHRLVPSLEGTCVDARVIASRHATVAAQVQRWAPSLSPFPGIYLAGDWMEKTYPGTLEAAVKSGLQAAHTLWDDFNV